MNCPNCHKQMIVVPNGYFVQNAVKKLDEKGMTILSIR